LLTPPAALSGIQSCQRELGSELPARTFTAVSILQDYPLQSATGKPALSGTPITRKRTTTCQATIAKQTGWRLKWLEKIDLIDSFFEQEIARD